MNYGMYISAGGVLTNMHRMDVVANNLANVNTVAFKPDRVYFQQRAPERLESALANADPQLLLERLGGGTYVAPTRTDLSQAQLVATGNDLDLAIRGEGFFVVAGGEGEGNERLRFTRDGRFTLNDRGELVMATTGMQVLDRNDQPIRIRPGARVRIDAGGRVFQNETEAAQLQVVAVPDRSSLRKTGENLFMFDGAAQTSRQVASVRLEQGAIEASAVDPIMALNELIGASKTAQSNSQMIQYHDTLNDQTINRFGRVA